MKRLIAAFVLILFVVGFIITSNRTINRSCGTLLQMVSQCEEDFKNNKSIDPSLSELESYWEKNEPMLMIFANHGTLEEIGYSIARVRAGDSEDFLKESAELKERLHHLQISEKLSLKTIF